MSDYTYWSRIKPPVRPSDDVNDYIRRQIKPRSRVLILGSTPEFRSLCHELDCEVIVADESRDIFENVSPLVTTKGPEKFLERSWKELRGMDLGCNYVLADGSFNMMPLAAAGEVVDAISKNLAPLARALIHVHYRFPSQHKSPLEIINSCLETHAEELLFQNTWVDLANYFCDARTGGFRYAEWNRSIEKLHTDRQISPHQYRQLSLGLHDIWIYMHPEFDFKSLWRDAFSLDDEFAPGDYANGHLHPVLNWQY